MKGFFSSSIVQREKPTGLIPQCGKCGLYKDCKSPKMEPSGSGGKSVLIVGDAPGETEDKRDRHFIGEAGLYLREVLDSIGVDLELDTWTTNALICHPRWDKPPDSKQIGYCRPNLTATLAKTKPRIVITLGRAALDSVLRGSWKDIGATLDKWTGWQIPLGPYWVCPTFHPTYLIRQKHNAILDRMFKQHLRAAFAITEEPETLNWLKDSVEILLDERAVYEALRDMDQQGGWAAVDYEGNCIKPEWTKAHLVSCAVSNGERTISYPWTERNKRSTGIFLRSKRTRKIASNLKMEERWTLKEFGHGVCNWGWDTMLATHCLDNRTGICSLKFQSLVQFGVKAYNTNIEPYLKSTKGPYNRIAEIDLRQLLTYGGMDAILEYMLCMKQRKAMGY
jgi:uracil-DNA glycosylase family 4